MPQLAMRCKRIRHAVEIPRTRFSSFTKSATPCNAESPCRYTTSARYHGRNGASATARSEWREPTNGGGNADGTVAALGWPPVRARRCVVVRRGRVQPLDGVVFRWRIPDG